MFRFHLWFIVVVLLGGVLAAGYFFGFDALEKEARRAAVSSLHEAASQAEARIRQLGDREARRASVLAARAGLPDELLPLAAGTGNPLAARDRIKAALERARSKAALLAVVDSRGAMLLRAGAAGDDLTISWLREVLQGLHRAELVAYRGVLYHVAAAPVLSGGRIVGALALGRRVGPAWIERLGADRRNGIAVVLGNKIVASNLAPRERGQLQSQLGKLPVGSPRQVTLRDAPFLAYRWTGLGERTAALVQVRSEQAAMAAFSDLRLMYLYVAGGAFLLALFWGFLTQRSFTRPLAVVRERVADPKAAASAPVSDEGLRGPFVGLVAAFNERLARRPTPAPAEAAAPVVVTPAPPEEEVETLDEAIPEPPVVPEPAAASPSAEAAVTLPDAVPPAPAPEAEQRDLLETDEEPGTLPGIGSPGAQARPKAPPPTPAPPPEAPPPAPAAPPEAPPAAALSDTLRGVVPPTEPPTPRRAADERTVIARPPEELLHPPPADPLEEALPQLHQRFLAARREAAESTEGLTFERFAARLKRTRDQLRAEHNCREVEFEVYVRNDGRAAVKAYPRGKIEGSLPPG